jgi:hydroxymethylbilane synthase
VVSSLVIVSRGSALALRQSETTREALLRHHPDLEVRIEVVRTTGDRIQDVPLARIGTRGLFTRELDEALFDGRGQLAVHSLKDLPTRLPEGLEIAAVPPREDTADALVLPAGTDGIALEDLHPGARIGTSALRRRAQLLATRPDLEVVDLRGNVDTRLAKVDRGDCDAIILASAGLRRLGLQHRISRSLDGATWLPAVGQGALALVIRSDDDRARELVRPLHDPETGACVRAERSMLHDLHGGCQVPVAGHAWIELEEMTLAGMVAGLDGTPVLRASASGPASEPEALGREVADALRRDGAERVLAEVRAAMPVAEVRDTA